MKTNPENISAREDQLESLPEMHLRTWGMKTIQIASVEQGRQLTWWEKVQNRWFT